MKLIRIAAAAVALVLAWRVVARRLKGELVAMSHPAGTFGTSSSSDEIDARALVQASWVDEAAIAARTAGSDAGSVTPSRRAPR
jgi:hypothetical protein